MVILTRVLPPGAGAFTVAPFTFSRSPLTPGGLVHEGEHMRSQVRWGIIGAALGMLVWIVMGWPLQPATFLLALQGIVEGWVIAQFAWRFCYLCLLPVWKNWFRERWERAAYRAEGLLDSDITKILRRKPYYLWGLK